ncbi:hypothetical protein [Ancylobacter sp. IITR112]|uniref:head-tail connector protein n=1 Tax=Ancylobacter sp. IITR112 TaxID=3138073 RepID=UPI00352BAAAD
MWYPASVVTPAEAEPVTLAQARTQCHVLSSETHFDALLTQLIADARDVVEQRCGIRIAGQTVVARCDGFADFVRLPVAPVQSVVTVAYVDTAGDDQDLDAGAYDLRADGLEAAIVPAFGQSWPAIRPGSRISVTMVAGFDDVPPSLTQAMLLHIAEAFRTAEPVKVDGWTTFDSRLVNFMRGA